MEDDVLCVTGKGGEVIDGEVNKGSVFIHIYF